MSDSIPVIILTKDDVFELRVARDRLRVKTDKESRGEGVRTILDDVKLLEVLEKILNQV